MGDADVVEEFYGVYLLRSSNPKFKGQTYIGYTVDPNRRVKQHNKGRQFGGAFRTSKRGPWDMILTIHGFPSDVAALRFEWAWQHPRSSRRLKLLVSNKKASESSLDFCLRVMWVMLSTPPWSRLPLTLRWLMPDFVSDPPPNKAPPTHMPIVHGPVVSKKAKPSKKKDGAEAEAEYGRCLVCTELTCLGDHLACLNTTCPAEYHVACLAQRFLQEEEESKMTFSSQVVVHCSIIPLEGTCVACASVVLWGEMVKQEKVTQISKQTSA